MVSPGYTPIQNTLFITKSVVRQRASDAILAALVSWLPEEIAAEQQPRGDLLRFKSADQLFARKRRILANSDRKAKPRGIRARRSLGQHQALFQRFERGRQIAEVLLAAFDKMGSFSIWESPSAACMSVAFRLYPMCE